MNNNFPKKCEYNLNIPDIGICCNAYYKSKRADGLGWCHFPLCSEHKCPIKHPELLEDAKLKGVNC